MNETAITMLEFNKIRESIRPFAMSEQAKAMIDRLQPSVDADVISNWLKETTEARAIVNAGASVPLHSMQGVEQTIERLGKGSSLLPEQLAAVGDFLENGLKLKKFMKSKEQLAPQISMYAYSMHDLKELAEEIYRCIRNNRVDDLASKELAKLRKKIGAVEDRIKSKLDSILRSPAYRDSLQDQLVSMRDGRYVIPVKREHRKLIDGHVLDSSSSGLTVFIEPEEVKKLQNELQLLKFAAESEEQRILSYLTGLVEARQREIQINMETMVQYDFIFAKAKYSKAIGGRDVGLRTDGCVDIKAARHPLLGEHSVPLYFRIGDGYRSLVITGPNTGGKTVAIKTVGLLVLMVQSGLHVPVEEGSSFSVFLDVLVDIGDGQSIEQSLSTFSSHVRNIISILQCAKPRTLVILDELGSGTDPREGMGLAIAILEEIHRQGATMLATTHYSEIKEFADNSPGFANGSMAFDLETLRPLYRLLIGQSGDSQAFSIALRLGMNRQLIERAHELTYKEKKAYADYVPPAASSKHQETVRAHHQQIAAQTGTELTEKKTARQQKPASAFQIGDRVYISSLKTSGIICEGENYKGELGVMVMKRKVTVHKNRLQLQIESKELYPDNYDMSIVLDSKENRKKAKEMQRKHVPGLTIERKAGDEGK